MNNTTDPHSETRTNVTAQQPSVDDLFDAFSAPRRRTVLAVLTERYSPMDVETLARAVAEREHDGVSAAPPKSDVESVRVTLHHVHLPKLDERRLVDYDRDERTVATTDVTETVPINVE